MFLYRDNTPQQPRRPGLGDDSADTSFFGGSFIGGSMLTAFVLGIGIIIAVKTVFSPSRGSSPGATAASSPCSTTAAPYR